MPLATAILPTTPSSLHQMKAMKHAALRITKIATNNISRNNKNNQNFFPRHFSLGRYYYPTQHHGHGIGIGIEPAVRRASRNISSSNTSNGNSNSNSNNNNNNNKKSTNNIVLDEANSISATSTTPKTKQQFTPLLQEYERQVNEGKLIFDPLQQRAAKKLTRLQLALREYDHAAFLERLELLERLEEEEKEQQQQRQCSSDEGSSSGSDGSSSSNHPLQTSSDVKSKTSEAAAAVEQKTASTASASGVPSNIPIPRGFYIYGDVGTGKSLLLNNFFHNAHIATSTTNTKKRRIHFHSFLQEIHTRIHTYNTSLLHQHGRSFHINTSQHRSRNPILTIAQELSNEVTLLCIDEFQVTDVADAMILKQFFGEVWRRGVVVVATSNRRPRDLYEGGVNREYFLPFLDLVERYCLVHHLSDDGGGVSGDDGDRTTWNGGGGGGRGGKDYRRIRSGVDLPENSGGECGFSEYYYLTREGNEEGEATSQKMDQLFQSFGGKHDSHQRPLVLPVHFQRTISIPRYHSNVIASFAFDELCTTELGSSDYQAIANHFRIVMIRNVPILTLTHPDRARRFITLIDELYEAGCCLVISAVDVPDRLFVGKETTATTTTSTTTTTTATFDLESHNSDGLSTSSDGPGGSMGTKSSDVLAIDVAQVQGTAVSELASVKELSFAFNRAASRILEMCSEAWWEERKGRDAFV